MARLNIFENIPALGFATNDYLWENELSRSLLIQGLYIPGSISFNQVAFLISGGTGDKTMSLNFALYSLNGSTLSLANSASGTTNPSNSFEWFTLVTSATQDITPGNWYIGFSCGISSATGQAFYVGPRIEQNVANNGWAGPFFRGRYTSTAAAFPVSIATSDLQTDGTGNSAKFPYFLLSA